MVKKNYKCSIHFVLFCEFHTQNKLVPKNLKLIIFDFCGCVSNLQLTKNAWEDSFCETLSAFKRVLMFTQNVDKSF